MIRLDYLLLPIQARDDWATVSPEELHYYEFIGNVTFAVDDIDFTGELDGLPVFDLALEFFQIASTLGEGESNAFEFTEADRSMRFERIGDCVLIHSPSGKRAVVALADFRRATRALLVSLLQELDAKCSRLSDNDHFR